MEWIYTFVALVLLIKDGSCIWYHCEGTGDQCECDKTAAVCETSFIIEGRLTMVDSATKKLVEPSGGQLYQKGSNQIVSVKNVISADGYNNISRMVVVANRTMPAPPLIVYKGQQLIINVVNKLKAESVTIHWHGLPQRGWEYMDGVPYLSQCPILSGQSFLYNFTATPSGTYWFHSHMGNQRGNGLFGALIIRERNPDIIYDEHIMTVIEWNHLWDADVSDIRIDLLDNSSEDAFHSGLINGRGRFNENGAPLEIFHVTQGKQYRFRIIGAGMEHKWEVSVDQHKLKVIASDGIDLDPITVDSVIINPGERYDFIIDASQPVASYWIRAKMVFKPFISTHAILNYDGASSNDPLTLQVPCTEINKCVVLNCPFPYFPESENKLCLTYKDIKGSRQDVLQPISNTDNFQELFLNFGFPGTGTPPSINGRKFVFPTVAALADPEGVDFNCDNADCGQDRICTCAHSLSLQTNNTVQVVLTNMGNGSFGASHPIHMHGHTFSIIKVGFGNYNTSTGILISQNDDINCQDGGDNKIGFCNNPTWRNPSWLNGNVPGLELSNPVGKDTIILPSGGYVVLRIVANNPGVWFMHCHIDFHAVGGMALMLNESFPDQPTPPPGFPSCKSYTPNTPAFSAAAFTAQEESNDNSQSGYVGGIVVLVIIVVIQAVVIGYLFRKVGTSRSSGTPGTTTGNTGTQVNTTGTTGTQGTTTGPTDMADTRI